MATAKKARRKPAAKKVNKTDHKLRDTLLLGLFIGGLVGFVAANIGKPSPSPDAPAAEVADEKPAKKDAVEPTYEFYTLLPEMEIEVTQKAPPPVIAKKATMPVKEKTAEELLAAALKKEAAETIVEENPADYVLQVGSFRETAVADRYKAKLALLGIESKIQTVTIDNTNTWHRVLVGPITGRAKADALKSRLKEDSIDSLLVRVKKG